MERLEQRLSGGETHLDDAPPPRRGRVARVREGGLAVVHRGERIIAAGDAAAELDASVDDAAGELELHFPVEVEVVGGIDEATREALVTETLRRLRLAVEARS